MSSSMGKAQQSQFHHRKAQQHRIHNIIYASGFACRHNQAASILSPSEVGLDRTKVYNAEIDSALIRFLQLCDPDDPLDNLNPHIKLLCSCQQLLSSA